MLIVIQLERMGDYAKGIARIKLMIGNQPLIKPQIGLPVMDRRARYMLHAPPGAFIECDVESAGIFPSKMMRWMLFTIRFIES